ncbi:hypothetical protein HDV63DRAFT_363745 [Trichoderma sp. SZMC 28014]
MITRLVALSTYVVWRMGPLSLHAQEQQTARHCGQLRLESWRAAAGHLCGSARFTVQRLPPDSIATDVISY